MADMRNTRSGSKRLSHGGGKYKSVGYSKNKRMQAFHEGSDLRPYGSGDPGNKYRKHGSGKKGKMSKAGQY